MWSLSINILFSSLWGDLHFASGVAVMSLTDFPNFLFCIFYQHLFKLTVLCCLEWMSFWLQSRFWSKFLCRPWLLTYMVFDVSHFRTKFVDDGYFYGIFLILFFNMVYIFNILNWCFCGEHIHLLCRLLLKLLWWFGHWLGRNWERI